MATLQGYCPECPCWFDIADPQLQAHHLCPCCLQPAAKTRTLGPAVVDVRRWPVIGRVRRLVAGIISH